MIYIQKETGYLQPEITLDKSTYQMGVTWQDYLNGKWIPLSEAQQLFRNNNSTASIKEVFDMQLTIQGENEPMEGERNLARITELKELLRQTDYLALKVVDGAMTAAEYEPTRVQRASWRAEINALENQ